MHNFVGFLFLMHFFTCICVALTFLQIVFNANAKKSLALETQNDPTSFDMTKLVVTILILQESFEWSLGAEQIVWQQVAAFHFAEAFFPHGISYA